MARFVAVFAICALALMGGQGHQAVGIEWLVVASGAAVIYVYGYVQAMRSGGSSAGLGARRQAPGERHCLLRCRDRGGNMLTAGQVAGLYVASVAMIAYVVFSVSGAWLLIIGVYRDQVSAGARNAHK